MTTITCRSDEDLRDLIERYGKRTVKALYLDGLIEYIISNEYLIECGFKKKILSAARGNITHGKMALHLNKSKGTVKHAFYGFTIYSTIENIEAEQSPKTKAILMRLYDRFYEAYIPKYRKKFEGIDLEIDPITCDTIEDPAYIKEDWDNNCKIVYSLDTIIQCYARKRVYTGFVTNDEVIKVHLSYETSESVKVRIDYDTNESIKVHLSYDTNESINTRLSYEGGDTVLFYKEVRLDHYISPYTNRKFITSDIICVNQNLLNN
jgi:hypothetical protein